MFEVNTGVRQGCPRSPTLFNFVVDWILRNALSEAPGVQLSQTFGLTDLAYADDIALFGDSFVTVQEAVNQVHPFAAVVGLRINASKTKVLSANVDPLLHQVINVGGEPLEEGSSFKYLGASFTATGPALGEIKARINVARAALNRLQPVDA